MGALRRGEEAGSLFHVHGAVDVLDGAGQGVGVVVAFDFLDTFDDEVKAALDGFGFGDGAGEGDGAVHVAGVFFFEGNGGGVWLAGVVDFFVFGGFKVFSGAGARVAGAEERRAQGDAVGLCCGSGGVHHVFCAERCNSRRV